MVVFKVNFAKELLYIDLINKCLELGAFTKFTHTFLDLYYDY